MRQVQNYSNCMLTFITYNKRGNRFILKNKCPAIMYLVVKRVRFHQEFSLCGHPKGRGYRSLRDYQTFKGLKVKLNSLDI